MNFQWKNRAFTPFFSSLNFKKKSTKIFLIAFTVRIALGTFSPLVSTGMSSYESKLMPVDGALNSSLFKI